MNFEASRGSGESSVGASETTEILDALGRFTPEPTEYAAPRRSFDGRASREPQPPTPPTPKAAMLWLQSFLRWVLWLLRRTLPRRALKQPKGKWTCQLCKLGLADDATLYRFNDMTLCKSCHAEAEDMCVSSDDECLL